MRELRRESLSIYNSENHDASALQPKTTRNTPVVEKVGFVAHGTAESTHTMGALEGISVIQQGLRVGDLGKGSRKRYFALDWILAGSRGNRTKLAILIHLT